MKKTMAGLLAVAFSTAPLAAETFKIDPNHSQIMFRIRHLVGRVTGRFTKFEGSFDYEATKPRAWKAQATIEAASIDTTVEKRDSHLRSPDFFNVEKCPSMEFKSAQVVKADLKAGKAKLQGELTIHCVTRPVVLDLEIGGVANDPWGNKRAGAIATGRINRKDFGIIWNKALDAGGVVLGEEVDIILEIEGIAQKPS
jgi:polyisoprenoid-binding protein YceI